MMWASIARSQSHLLLLEDEYRRRGLSSGDARRAARLALGGVDRTKEIHREARSFAWVDDTRRDLRYAARLLVSNVGFTLAIVLTIGLAIGGTGAVFSLVNAVLLKTLPYRDPARLVVIGEGDPRRRRGARQLRAADVAQRGVRVDRRRHRTERDVERRPSGEDPGAASHAQLLRPARRGARAGARVSRRRGHARGAACGHPEPRLLARPLRRRPGHRRPRPPLGQLACHRRWRHARGVSVPRRGCRFVDACGLQSPAVGERCEPTDDRRAPQTDDERRAGAVESGESLRSTVRQPAGDRRRVPHARHIASRVRRRRRPASIGRADGRGRRRDAHRLCECGKPAARARGGTAARDRSPALTGRDREPYRAAAAGREPGPQRTGPGRRGSAR